MTVYQRLFPFTIHDISEELKYLGFQLKPNSYRKEDWKWMITKLEKRLNGWSFRWLSRASRLTLTKSILEAIPIYWMSLAWIPKRVLQKNLCSIYLVRDWRKVYSAMGKMGKHSNAKSAGRLGAQKHLLVFKGPCSKILLEDHFGIQFVVSCSLTKTYFPGFNWRLDHRPKQICNKWIDYLESDDLLILSGRG